MYFIILVPLQRTGIYLVIIIITVPVSEKSNIFTFNQNLYKKTVIFMMYN
jgi:hypothetical protein